MSDLEDTLLSMIITAGFPEPKREYRFHPVRKWQADFAWPDKHVIVEVEGGTYVRGRHVSGKGYAMDCQKYNEAQLYGWKVLRFTTEMIHGDGKYVIDTLTRALGDNP